MAMTGDSFSHRVRVIWQPMIIEQYLHAESAD